MLRIITEPVGKLDELGQRWRALEAEADGGFFRSWTFLGCLAAERFGHARLLSVTQDGVDVALALLGQGRGGAWLNQTGTPALDSPFIEHNGLLIRRGHQGIVPACLGQAVREAGRLVLSGVDGATLAAARGAGWLVPEQSRFAPSVALDRLSAPYLQTLSAGARAQIRRSQRSYGPGLKLSRAGTLAQAQAWFSELVQLHQQSWTRRGKPGAFATEEATRFHQMLIDRAWPLGETDLLRVAAGDRVVGLLYNFMRDGRVLSYQSGFAYDPASKREKPGLVCHALAIEHYASRGARVYDLLAGADRYKLTLAQDGETLHWATLYRPWSAAGMAAAAVHLARKYRLGPTGPARPAPP